MPTFGALVYIISYSVTGMSASVVLADIGGIGGMLTTFINNVTDILKGLGLGATVIGIIIGGLMRATAFGNERKVAISNQAIACAIVGLVIVLVASTVATGMQALFH